MLAPNHTYLACSTGLTRYIEKAKFIEIKDYCVLIQLYPRFTIHKSKEIIDFWDKGTMPHRYKREPFTTITLAILLGLGATGADTGFTSLVTTPKSTGV